MGFRLAELFVEVKERGVAQVAGGIDRIKASMSGVVSMAPAFTTMFSAAGLGLAAKAAIGLAAAWESLAVSFKVMLGDGDKASKLLADIRDFAAATPFELGELANASKALLAFGVTPDDLIPTLRQVGDVASGLGIP